MSRQIKESSRKKFGKDLSGQRVAELTFRQINSQKGMQMIGGYNVTYDEKGTLSFRFKARASNSSNFCKIDYTSRDTYDMTFGRISGSAYKPLYVLEDIYGDELMDNFERETGLYLTL